MQFYVAGYREVDAPPELQAHGMVKETQILAQFVNLTADEEPKPPLAYIPWFNYETHALLGSKCW